MPDIIIRRVSDEIHSKLKARAAKNKRSMNMEILALLEEILEAPHTIAALPTPYRGSLSIDDEWLENARNEGSS